jgi:5-methylcytosine-specific restriction endonuclease McrA
VPTLPTYTKCSHLGCKEQRGKYNSFCSEHGGLKKITESRKHSDSMYQTAQWRAKRKIELSRNSLCASCLTNGRATQAQHVDHVFPWSVIGEQAFYRNLFQCLCAECHSYKTGQEQKGVILYFKNDGVVTYKLNDYYSAVSDGET